MLQNTSQKMRRAEYYVLLFSITTSSLPKFRLMYHTPSLRLIAEAREEVTNTMETQAMKNSEKSEGEKQVDCNDKSSGTTEEEWTKACPWCGANSSEDCCGLHPEAMAAADQAANVAAKAKPSKAKRLKSLPI